MIGVIEFFKALPKKKCQKCNKDFKQNADCYGNICDECDHPAR